MTLLSIQVSRSHCSSTSRELLGNEDEYRKAGGVAAVAGTSIGWSRDRTAQRDAPAMHCSNPALEPPRPPGRPSRVIDRITELP